VIFLAEKEIAGGELGGKFGIFEPELIETGFVAENGDIVIETLNVGKIPGVKEEVTITKSIFEAVGGKARDIVIGDGEELVIGDFSREDAVSFELAGDDA